MNKLICVSLISVSLIAHPKPNDALIVKHYADYYSEYYRIPKIMFYRVIEAESPWYHLGSDTLKMYSARKQLGDHNKSFGPMQIKLKTAQALWPNIHITRKKLLTDIELNIASGAKLLDQEFTYFRPRTKSIKQAWLMALTSYNLGRETALKLRKPSKYAKKIMRF